MKKWIAVLCAVLFACTASAALADSLYKSNMPETLKTLIAGKRFCAGITDWSLVGEDEDTKFTLSVTVYERDQFDASVVDNLQNHDILCFGNGTVAVVQSVTRDAYGVDVTGFDGDLYCFTKTDEGTYTVAAENDYPYWTEVCSIKVPLGKDIRFLDQSDPENPQAVAELGYYAFLDKLQEETNFSPYNTQLAFDAEGNLAEIVYTYSPWN